MKKKQEGHNKCRKLNNNFFMSINSQCEEFNDFYLLIIGI